MIPTLHYDQAEEAGMREDCSIRYSAVEGSGCLDNDARNTRYPQIPDNSEPAMIPKRSSNNRLIPVFSNAREPIKKLMVNPTPQSRLVP